MILVDTDVLIDALKGRDPARTRVADGLRQDGLATTTISAFELSSGARSDKQVQAIAALLAPMRVIPFDLDAAHAAADIRQKLEAAGEPIGMGDYLIAGVAVSRSLPLLTRNRKHFDRVPDLRLADL